MLHRGADQIQWSLQQSTTLSTIFARNLKHFFCVFFWGIKMFEHLENYHNSISLQLYLPKQP